ncbi:RNA helicase [Aeromonas salmonicida subsp. salmonicida]|uniref:ATP-dependent RNA helicase DeaD n=2 Tax=Aeromonas salmonicida subsp. salmonicida TaxID=29491 RepID=A4SNQ9_AERS4|nr:DEAD/DEAH box helicase [Aeromonas salmonicida]ABO90531.1 ATP-dependent RNA helicase [Aeromonas salmonicida subsp. salmonicida A449]AYO63538.1 ATP-dependent RNA helicase [Aeromonas salmonicida subsp. salmonicida 01-B526]EHI54116.1 ATP-dependent RNA helicase [Aeromonas salmonicida subsp. salmonicida 01-B526]EKP0241164.1 DEAD/DEAH box helicase [Aeromonas salmonicida]EKP0245307.1 DEAD/DEAH box helicase [Aeromonas salmonicida]
MSDTEQLPLFSELGLAAPVLKALQDVGYERPSPIQAAAIPHLMAGHDLLGQAQTGTGKTAAFALPLLSRLEAGNRNTQVLVLAPTRELALQVAEACQRYAKHMPDFHVLPIYGGSSYETQTRALRRGAQVVVGTPGRVMDLIRRKNLDLSGLKALVLDEADEMLRMGFIDDVDWIMEQCPSTRQVALFSATMPDQIRRVAQKHLKQPKEIKIVSKTSTAPTIRQRYWQVTGLHKLDAMTRLLEVEPYEAVLVFVRTKNAAEELAGKLAARGHACEALHGDIPQKLRERTVDKLRQGQLDILIATDVVARGLDVERITHVVNYDIPYDTESYVHRIGRTGRAGRKGEAILFVAPRERRMLRAIEHATRQAIEPMKMPSTEDINQHRMTKFKERIRETMMGEELELYLNLVNELIEEDSADPLELAAALAKLVQGDQPLLLDDSIPEPQFSSNDRGGRDFERRDGGSDFADRGDRPARRMPSLEPRPLKDNPDVEMERYRVDVGAHHGVKPGQIVGAIANEANIESRFIGNIDIADDFSTVDLPKGMTADVLEVIKKARVCQRPLMITRYTEVPAGSNTAPRPPRSDRPFNKSGERREGGFNKDRKFGGNKRRDS